ncbi:hypothetical protein L612_003300000210 [Rhodococcus rhodochrous J38]|nr:hypothetical protein L612_003300000210 [Rhodococcus rhodochrous J38]
MRVKTNAVRCSEFRSISAKFDRMTSPRKGALSCAVQASCSCVRWVRFDLLRRFIFLAVISSHDPSHVAHRLEFYFHGSMVRESRADALTDRNYESCPHVPDFAEIGEIRGEGAEGQCLPSPACREPSCSDIRRGALSKAGTAQIVGAAGGARYWLAVRRPKHAIGPLLTSSNRTGGGVDEPGRSSMYRCGRRRSRRRARSEENTPLRAVDAGRDGLLGLSEGVVSARRARVQLRQGVQG